MYTNGGADDVWQPCENLVSKCKDSKYAVVILNTPIEFSFPPSFLLDLWSKAEVRITVDGGTNRWVSWLKRHKVDKEKVNPPHFISGDMDSILPESLRYFSTSSSAPQIIKTPDQDETDFTKALRELHRHCLLNALNIETVYAISDTSGRFDQIMANINTLYKARDILPGAKVFQIAASSVTWLLSEGRHTISVPPGLRENQEWCALIPFTRACHVTTTGLRWNLDNTKMEFGGMVSTSNTYSGAPMVTVQTDEPLVWSMGIESLAPVK